jgi:hypothetical protein
VPCPQDDLQSSLQVPKGLKMAIKNYCSVDRMGYNAHHTLMENWKRFWGKLCGLPFGWPRVKYISADLEAKISHVARCSRKQFERPLRMSEQFWEGL